MLYMIQNDTSSSTTTHNTCTCTSTYLMMHANLCFLHLPHTVLNVEGNALEELPASLGHLKLKRLVANDNRLQVCAWHCTCESTLGLFCMLCLQHILPNTRRRCRATCMYR